MVLRPASRSSGSTASPHPRAWSGWTPRRPTTPHAQQAKANFKTGVRVRVNEVRAAQPDADLLKALDVASRAAGQGGTVVLVDSGLQTKAPLDFTSPGLLDADTGYLVDYLRRGGFLPDLRGRVVILAGIGVPAAPQAALDLPRQRHLVHIWTAIATAAGAMSVSVSCGQHRYRSATLGPARGPARAGA